MTNVIINKEELLNEEQLDRIAGGNLEELQQLTDELIDNLWLKGMAAFSGSLPFASKAMKSEVTKILDKMGIEANIDVNTLGFLGFNIGEKNNTYKDKFTGKSLTHQQVLNRIKNFVG